MNSKERVLYSLNFKKPDRVPRYIWFGLETRKILAKRFRIEPFEIDFRFRNDILQDWVSINGGMERDIPENSKFIDEWGITWERKDKYNNVKVHPLKGKDIRYVMKYKFPNPKKPERFKKLEYLLKNFGNEYFVGSDVSSVLFDPACHLRGMENLLIDMAEENKILDILLDKLKEFCITVSKESIDRGVDWIWMGDDLGSQGGMLVSPDMWRKHIKPRMKEVIDILRDYKKDVIIAYHSCGSIYPIIEDLVDVGINVLNPIQESAKDMNQLEIKKEFGDKVTLMCGLDTQSFLLNATKEEVGEMVYKKVNELGYNGGFIFAASHAIQPDIPLENILAMFNALDRL